MESNVRRCTYRLQLNGDFGFHAAASIAPYLAALGVSHVYLSPVLQAAPGSTHGYDVVDHSKASDELGGDEGFRSMVGAFAAEGLGVLLDVVPNHMAAALPQNRWWWDVLENGPSSFWASFFDIDWDPPESSMRNRVLLPVLGERYGRALDAIDMAYDGHTFTTTYYDNVFPLAPRSLDTVLAAAARACSSTELDFIASALGALPPAWATDRDSVRRRHRDKGVLLDRVAALYHADAAITAAIDEAIAAVNADNEALDALLERQNYRLAFWRTASDALDYRRFFDIDTLVALRVEDQEVMVETHAHVLGWIAEGLVDGLRIDHIDGLADPLAYLGRLHELTGGTWVVVEKILESGERLPEEWPVGGTTGYDFLNQVAKLFIDPAGEEPMTEALAALAGDTSTPESVVRAGKELIVDTSLNADLNRVVERMVRLARDEVMLRDVTRSELHTVLRELVVAFPVYRTYAGSPASLIAEAAASLPEELDGDVVQFVVDVLTGPTTPERRDASARFEQLTGPVMAKGVEDTAFYRYHRLSSQNEVGSDLAMWSVGVDDWHRWCSSAGGASLLATSTHDTKRSEDVRARIGLLSEMPAVWSSTVTAWRALTDGYRTGELPDRPTEYLLFQAIAGAWPLSVERALAYAQKATREAKVHTSWTDPNPSYDAAVEGWIRGALDDPAFVAEVERFVAVLEGPGRVVSLAQTLCKLTAPGVPDIYQGTELWDLSLVDPDNRRPVDYGARAALLARLGSAAEALASAEEGVPKLLVTQRALDLRRRRPRLFEPGAAYVPVGVEGPAAAHVVAFGRGSPVGAVTVVPRLLVGLTSLEGTTVDVPAGSWKDVFTGRLFEVSGEGGVAAADLFEEFPVVLLERL